MSKLDDFLFYFWTLAVIVGAALITLGVMSTKNFDDPIVVLENVSSGWYLDIDSESDVTIDAADGSYFQLTYEDEDTFLYGEPSPPPLDYISDEYFSLSAPIENGLWEVSSGASAAITLTSESDIEAAYYPSGSNISTAVFAAAILGLIVWAVGLLFLSIIFDW